MMALRKPLFIIFFLLLFSQQIMAAPSGKELLHACEAALLNGFTGIEGQLCEWYVTPCDCHAGKDLAIPRVCLPEIYSSEALAREIIQGLLQEPALQKDTAEMAAGIILSRSYPCGVTEQAAP